MREKLEICEKNDKVLHSPVKSSRRRGCEEWGEVMSKEHSSGLMKHIYLQNPGESLPNRLNKKKSVPYISQCNCLKTQN